MAQAKKKPGRVVRLSPKLQAYVEARLRTKETFDACLRRLLALPKKREKGRFETQVCYVLPSDIFETKAEAKGAAIVRAVRTKKQAERPIEMKRVE
jgi:hypothetical protein